MGGGIVRGVNVRGMIVRTPLTSVQNFTEIVLGEAFRRGVKRKRGSKIERCHVRVSHLLISFLS